MFPNILKIKADCDRTFVEVTTKKFHWAPIRRTFRSCVYHVSVNGGRRATSTTSGKGEPRQEEVETGETYWDMRYWWFIYEAFFRSASRRVLCDSVQRSWCNYVNLLTTPLAQVVGLLVDIASRTIGIRGRRSYIVAPSEKVDHAENANKLSCGRRDDVQ